ncbi:MAG: hybrid sensor histidine kinase/response regulator, partial [Bacteroidota bacterium]
MEFLGELKKKPDFSSIPIVFLTGNVDMGDLRKAMKEGADDYLTKPFTAEDLLSAIETRLSKNNSQHQYYESKYDDVKKFIAQSLPHEYRTPLNGILGFSQLMRDENSLSKDEIKEYSKMIYQAGIRLLHLLENMNIYAQLKLWVQDNEVIHELRQGPGAGVLNAIQSALKNNERNKELPGSIVISGQDVVANITQIHLAKIIEELLDNAVKFSKPDTKVYVSCIENGKKIEIVVRDQGRGMSEEQIGKIAAFRQYERGSYEQQGAGLGLAICKALAEIFDGTLSIQSEVGIGTTVSVFLPSVKEKKVYQTNMTLSMYR